VHDTAGSLRARTRVAPTAPEYLQACLATLALIGKTTTSLVLGSHFEGRARLPGDQLPLPRAP
jgi:hypothetical protein